MEGGGGKENGAAQGVRGTGRGGWQLSSTQLEGRFQKGFPHFWISLVRNGASKEGTCTGVVLADGAAGANVLRRERAGQGSGSDEDSGQRGRRDRKEIFRLEVS